jgi:S-methylmethionine-dependent homocysteine/selenocysteine methylase
MLIYDAQLLGAGSKFGKAKYTQASSMNARIGSMLQAAERSRDDNYAHFVSPAPQHYMIGCLYPTHAQTALRALCAARPDLVTRVRGLKANASPLSPDELDKLDRLAATDYQTWARDEIACAREFDLRILGGCCGTDRRYIEALAKEAQVSL